MAIGFFLIAFGIVLLALFATGGYQAFTDKLGLGPQTK